VRGGEAGLTLERMLGDDDSCNSNDGLTIAEISFYYSGYVSRASRTQKSLIASGLMSNGFAKVESSVLRDLLKFE
jgi:hypothetical protein